MIFDYYFIGYNQCNFGLSFFSSNFYCIFLCDFRLVFYFILFVYFWYILGTMLSAGTGVARSSDSEVDGPQNLGFLVLL